MEKSVPTFVTEILRKQKYHFVGRHSAVKRCRWLYETLINNRPCYKQKFYGIKTHQCIQMTPSAFSCTQQCLFCWRAQSSDLQTSWNELAPAEWDSAGKLVEETVRAHLAILTGYKDNPKTDRQKLKEALTPRHVAISLSGEPTLYAHLDELIRIFHEKKFTTFLVSNGTVPSALTKLSQEPTQLYISVCAPDETTFKTVCRPHIPKGWEKLNRTLETLTSFRCPTVMRITCVRGLNMKNVEGYSALVNKAQPTYIEAKAYMHVGYSRRRLSYDNTPSHDEIKKFSRQLEQLTGYNLIDESSESRVALLSKLEFSRRLADE